MIISIDTEMMNTMAGLAQTASEEQDASVVSLIPVVEHYDWNCKERDEINERILSIKKGNQKLSERLQEFAMAIKKVANRFDEEENAIPGRYQYLDTLLGQASASESAGVVENGSGAVTKAIAADISQTQHVDSKLENYELGNILQPITNFEIIERSMHIVGPGGVLQTWKDFPLKISEEFLEAISKNQE